ncbi:MAG TPA: hypothetical protein VD902_08855 [Symbiobacteriaceae bacterium]|nr:hypothetical protein [Symbiobacteriaceae bacterium]
MAKGKQKPSGNIEVRIDGTNFGTIVGGNENLVTTEQAINSNITEADHAELERMLADLKAQVAKLAAPEQKQDALSRVNDLEKAVKKPTKAGLSTMEYVKNWFGDNLPQIAEKVSAVMTNPTVVKMMRAAGAGLMNEFQRRFGG